MFSRATTYVDVLVYVGDGTSDIAAARLAHAVFARDSLLSGLKGSYDAELRPFGDLRDVARGLGEVVALHQRDGPN